MSVLDKIFAQKALEVEAAKREVPESTMRRMAEEAPPTRGFRDALKRAELSLALIAEVKKASPSQGLIRPDFDPSEIAQTYEKAGAHCLSILTDENFFQGAPEYLVRARKATCLPVLRKDFLNDPYQVYQSRAWGADAILLIVASLEPAQVRDLQALAFALGMDVLVEVHNDGETDVALESGANLIGVNNRDLSTFQTSLATSERILPRLRTSSPDSVLVSESALENYAHVQLVAAAGADSVLIGTSFCASPDIGAKVREVMNW